LPYGGIRRKEIKMKDGPNIGNTTDYFPNPCPSTVNYYSKQISDSLRLAFRENPKWEKPGSKVQVMLIIEEIEEWYNPFQYTALVSSTFDRLWSQALRELRESLNKKVPRVRKNSKINNRTGSYNPAILKKLFEGLKGKGLTVKTISDLIDVHFTSVYDIVNGTGGFRNCRITKTVNKLFEFLESLGIDTGVVVKSICGGSGGSFYKKCSLAAKGKEVYK
jgi:hypothetical protein